MTVTYDGGDMFKLWLESGQFVLMSREDCQGVLRNADYIGIEIPRSEECKEVISEVSEEIQELVEQSTELLEMVNDLMKTVKEYAETS